jgi:hypothetical protein
MCAQTQGLESRLSGRCQNILQSYPNITHESISEEDLMPFLSSLGRYKNVLKDVSINVEYANIAPDMMRAMPCISSLLGKKNDRKYHLYISANNDESCGVVFNKMNFVQKKGEFGHENYHMVDYQQKSILQFAGFGLLYGICWLIHDKWQARNKPNLRKPFEWYMSRFENKIDRGAIAYGLGLELARGTDYMLNISNISRERKDESKRLYLGVEQILDETMKLYFKKLNSPNPRMFESLRRIKEKNYSK